MQTEAGHLAYRICERLLRIAGRQRLQAEYLAARLRTDRDAVRDRVA